MANLILTKHQATRPKTYILNDKKVSCENCSTMRAEIEELKEGRGDWIDLTSVKLEAQQEHSKSMGKVSTQGVDNENLTDTFPRSQFWRMKSAGCARQAV